MEHHFNTIVATKYGVNEAIFCHNLYFWIKKNQANKRHIYDGNVWTYNTMEAFTELFPYWTLKQIRTIISNCEKKNLIVKGNYNLKGYDRTIWYALSDAIFEIYEGKTLDIPHMPKKANEEQQELPKWANASAQMGTPIPDSKPDNKQIKKEEEEEAPQLSILMDIFTKNISKNGKDYIESQFAEWLKILPYEVIKKQLEICIGKNAGTWTFVNNALNDLKVSNITTIEQLEQKQAVRKNSSDVKKPFRGKSKPQRVEKVAEWFEPADEYYSGLGVAAVAVESVEPDLEAKKRAIEEKLKAFRK